MAEPTSLVDPLGCGRHIPDIEATPNTRHVLYKIDHDKYWTAVGAIAEHRGRHAAAMIALSGTSRK